MRNKVSLNLAAPAPGFSLAVSAFSRFTGKAGAAAIWIFMSGFIKLNRIRELEELFKHPHEWTLLSIIAYRLKRTENKYDNLEIGEAQIGDIKNMGMTQRAYRTAKQNLEKWKLATFKTTNKGTIAKLYDTRVYDINQQTKRQAECQSVDKQSDKPATTNNNVKNEKKKPCSPELREKKKSIKEALCQFFELDPKEKSEHSRIGLVVKALANKNGTTIEGMGMVKEQWYKIYPDAHLTPEAMAKHWDEMVAEIKKNRNKPRAY